MKQKISYILLGLSIIGILLLILWPRPDLNKKVQDLTVKNIILKKEIKTKDSIIEYFRLEIDELDKKLDSSTTTMYKTRIIYQDRIKEIPTYLPYQIDSFFKQRYQ